MTAVKAKEYAERKYRQYLAEFTPHLSENLVKLIKNRLANAYVDGFIAGAAFSATTTILVTQPITATVNQPQSEEWSK